MFVVCRRTEIKHRQNTSKEIINTCCTMFTETNMGSANALAVFEGKKIRKTWHNEEWWFSVVDVMEVLTDSTTPKRYWSDLKIKLGQEGNQPYDFIVQLKLLAEDGKMRETDCINTEGAFRIIQSIPSPKAEPFKLWLAKTGYERVQEIENPELTQKRMKEIYQQKGYSEEWIEKRVRGIAVRNELTDEWKKRGAQENTDFAILTNDIIRAAFGKTVQEYKEFKGLGKENLRDHMEDLELILTMLGEASTTKLTKERDSKQIPELKKDSTDGGSVAGVARKNLEQKMGKPVVSKENYLKEPEKNKRKQLK